MSKEISIISDINSELAVIDNKKMAKINERMNEIDRANLTASKKNTQSTSQLMTLTMLCDAPYRRLRQVLSQIERKREALEDASFKFRKQKIQIDRYRKSGDELLILKADELENQILRSKNYIEAALKELATYQDVYDEIKTSHNIPDDWDEMDMEKEEISNHIRMAFRNGVRNMVTNGTLGNGTLEYLEQFGIHPITAKQVITDYLSDVEKMINEKKMPSVNHLYDFLDQCADIFQDAHKAVMKRIGIDELIKDEYLFKEMRDVA